MTAEHPPLPPALADAPSSARLVWKILDEAESPLTRSEIHGRAYVSEATLDRALKEYLYPDGHVEREPACGAEQWRYWAVWKSSN